MTTYFEHYLKLFLNRCDVLVSSCFGGGGGVLVVVWVVVSLVLVFCCWLWRWCFGGGLWWCFGGVFGVFGVLVVVGGGAKGIYGKKT